MKTCLIALILITFSATSTGAKAQMVYKCGNAYSQTPCPDATVLQLEELRPAAQVQQTSQTARNNKKMAVGLEKTRLAEEKSAAMSAKKMPKPVVAKITATKPSP